MSEEWRQLVDGHRCPEPATACDGTAHDDFERYTDMRCAECGETIVECPAEWETEGHAAYHRACWSRHMDARHQHEDPSEEECLELGDECPITLGRYQMCDQPAPLRQTTPAQIR